MFESRHHRSRWKSFKRKRKKLERDPLRRNPFVEDAKCLWRLNEANSKGLNKTEQSLLKEFSTLSAVNICPYSFPICCRKYWFPCWATRRVNEFDWNAITRPHFRPFDLQCSLPSRFVLHKYAVDNRINYFLRLWFHWNSVKSLSSIQPFLF